MSSAGPNFPLTATGTTNVIGGGTRVWTNPGNIGANDGNLATAVFPAGAATSEDLIGSNFNFSIPSTAIIDGILLEINYQDITGAGTVSERVIQLLKGGTLTGVNRSTSATIPPAATTVSFGGSSDLWGATWTPADINGTGFSAVFIAISPGGAIDAIGVDFFRITIFFHNVFNDTLSFSSTANLVESPANKLNAALVMSATPGLSESATLTVHSTMAFSSTAGMTDIGTNIPGAPTAAFSVTASMAMTASNIISTLLPFSSTVGLSEIGSTSGTRGISFSTQASVFMSALVGGRPIATVEDYTSLVTSEHNKRPNFMAMIAQDVQGYVDTINLLRTFEKIFDIDQAQGQQLDMIGVWVGVSRNIAVPLTGVYFAFNTALVGFNQGTWLGIGDSTSGLTVLGDADYLLLLKAKIASNHWDGTVPSAYNIWAIVFAGQPFTLLIQDGQDMTMAIIVIGVINTAVTLSLIVNGYIGLRPAGVLITGYYQNSVPNFPVFGFGPESATLAGFNDAAWVKKIG